VAGDVTPDPGDCFGLLYGANVYVTLITRRNWRGRRGGEKKWATWWYLSFLLRPHPPAACTTTQPFAALAHAIA